MKKIFALLLVTILIFSLTACGEKDDTNTTVFKDYQTISYTDFNNFSTDKQYKVIENTDNSAVDFNRSFIAYSDYGFNCIFYELENKDLAYAYFNKLVQAYESFTADYASMRKYGNYGCYVLQDEKSIVYISYVENTLLYSMMFSEAEDTFPKMKTEITEFIKFLDYPMIEFPM